MHRYLAARTTFVDEVVLDAIDRGVDQVVLLGAGYDGRSLRFASPGVRFYEVDHPATQADKLARLERLGIASDDVTFVAADFTTDDVGATLVAHGLDSGRAALHVLEGVASYLELSVLEALLTSVRRTCAPGSTLVVTLGAGRERGDPGAAVRAARFRAAVAALGEPIRSTIDPADVDGLLARTGWIGASDARWVQWRARGLGLVVAAPVGSARGGEPVTGEREPVVGLDHGHPDEPA